MDAFYLFFFLLTLLSNIVLFWLALMIFWETREYVKGWREMALYGCALSGMSFMGILRVLTEGSAFQPYAILLLALFSLAAAFLIVLGSTALISEVGIQPKILSKRNVYIVATALFIALIAAAFPFDTLWSEKFYAIVLYVFAFCHLAAAAHFIKLFSLAKKMPWFFLVLGTIGAGAFMLMLVYTGTCCAADGPLAGAAACGDRVPPFSSFFPQYCSEGLMTFNQPAYMGILLSSIAVAIGYFLACRQFFGMFGGKKA